MTRTVRESELDAMRHRVERAEGERDQLKGAIHSALADYAKGKPVDQIMRELKDVERDYSRNA